MFIFYSGHGASLNHGELHAVVPNPKDELNPHFINLDEYINRMSTYMNVNLTCLLDCCRERITKGTDSKKVET